MSTELPKIKELEEWFGDTQQLLPNIDGYAVFTFDETGPGAFNLSNSLEAWKELFTSILIIEALHFDYDIYESNNLNKPSLIYNNLMNSKWNEEHFNYLIND
jgi:hypothetical protein